jgi:hypothetical protein
MTTPVPTTPKGKMNRQKVLLAGAGLVLVVFLFMRSRGSATATPAEDPNSGQTVAQPATFADNGAQAASLGDSVTGGLGDVATSLDNETTAFQSLADALNANAGSTPASPTTPSSTVGQGAASTPAVAPPMVASAIVTAQSGQLRPVGGTKKPPATTQVMVYTPPAKHPTPPPAKKPPKQFINAGHRAAHH